MLDDAYHEGYGSALMGNDWPADGWRDGRVARVEFEWAGLAAGSGLGRAVELPPGPSGQPTEP